MILLMKMMIIDGKSVNRSKMWFVLRTEEYDVVATAKFIFHKENIIKGDFGLEQDNTLYTQKSSGYYRDILKWGLFVG